MLAFLSTIISVLAWWLVLGLLLGGIGLLARRLLGLRVETAEDAFSCFWVGWAGAVAGLQIWHFWLPVDGWAGLAVAVAGAIGLLWNRTHGWALVSRFGTRRTVLALVLLLVGIWLAARATGPVRHFDTGFYLLPTWKWISAHPLVPGLGNLYGRLAFNSSFLLFAALVDSVPGNAGAHFLANGLLVYVLAAQALVDCRRLFSDRGPRRLQDLFRSLLLGPILVQAWGPEISSLSTDLVVFTLHLVIASELLAFLLDARVTGREARWRLLALGAVAAAGMAVKLSLVVAAGGAVLLALAVWWRRGGHRVRELAAVVLLLAACGLVILAPWMVRGVLLSGYVAYPTTVGSVAVEWRVPRPLVIDEAMWIYALPRDPRSHWSVTLSGWDWLGPWLRRLPGNVTGPSLLALLALMAAAALRRRPPRARVPWLFLLPTAASLVFWFFTAPSPRFAVASFSILAAGVALAVPRRTFPGLHLHSDHALVVVLLASTSLAAAVWPLRITTVAGDPIRADFETRTTHSGLRINVPRDGFLCGDAPLPCTPYFRPNLRLRAAGDLRRGFVPQPDPERRIPPLPRQNRAMTPRAPDEVVPAGFAVSPDLGVTLISGWREYRKTDSRRVMRGQGRFLIYTEEATTTRLTLRPCRADPAEDAETLLEIRLNDAPVHSAAMVPDRPIAVDLRLRPDFNVVTLEALPDGAIDAGGQRRVRVAFCAIEVRSRSLGMGGAVDLNRLGASTADGIFAPGATGRYGLLALGPHLERRRCRDALDAEADWTHLNGLKVRYPWMLETDRDGGDLDKGHKRCQPP